MKWSYVALAGSITAVVLGFTLVILFSKLYVVPHLLTQDFYRTHCHIDKVRNMSRGLPPCSSSNSNTSSVRDPKLDSTSGQDHVKYQDDCNGSKSNLTSMPCVSVEVTYTDYESKKQVGKLLADGTAGILSNGPATLDQCFCHDCSLTLVTSAHGVVTSLNYSGRVLRVGDSVRCYFIMPHRTTLSLSRTSNWVVLNAILWPSLLFIAGFVGLFFSCVFLQADRAKALQKKKARARALDRS